MKKALIVAILSILSINLAHASVSDDASYLLKKTIQQTAKDPDSIKYRNQRFYSNGYCVEFNAKNSFGAYAGYQDACLMVKNGKFEVTVNGQ
jgi:hypothetical protein